MKRSHRDVMVDLARQHGWTRGVELGVKRGQLLARLLAACPQLHMIGVDHWALAPANKARAFEVAGLYPGRVTLYTCTTDEAAALVPDGSVDFVFLDADHSHEAVRRDIEMWRAKVRPGGWFGGHDIDSARHPGVARAVTETFGTHWIACGGRVWQAVTT